MIGVNLLPKIAAIYRYPVKGLGPNRLESAELAPGQTITGDRLYAIENGPSGFDPCASRLSAQEPISHADA